jgi:hypothetical protein
LREIFDTHRGESLRAMLQRFEASGAAPHKIATFFDANPTGAGTVRDQIAADMTNELLAVLGQRKRQSAEEVRRLRERGQWRRMGERPEGPGGEATRVLTAPPRHTKLGKR